MKHLGKKRLLMVCIGMAILLLLSTFLFPTTIIAKAETSSANGNVYSYSQLMSCADGSGYADPKQLSVGDPLIGVRVAEIELSNFSATTVKEGKRYFLKTSPDIPVLSIAIKTDLNNLGGSGAWVNADGDTRIPDYGFVGSIGYGWLGISHTDYQGKVQTICITDAFKKAQSGKSFTPAWFGSEGSYKVTLCFEAKRQTGSKKKWDFWPFKYHYDPVYGYTNYRIDAEFEIRNANSQVFAFDSKGNELLNGSTCSEFTLDYANSHYLQISIKREVAISANELMESTDVRFNSVGVDKRTYSTPGLYTIEVYNEITGARTSRRILVVDEADQEETNLLIAATANKYSEFSSSKPQNSESNSQNTAGSNSSNTDTTDNSSGNRNIIITIICAAAALIGTIIVTLIIVRHKRNS